MALQKAPPSYYEAQGTGSGNNTLLIFAGLAVAGYLLLSPKKKGSGLNAPKPKKIKAKGKKPKKRKTKK